jgi:O-antigen ligase/tetratricopeptide (TPR) repeat protein
VAEAIRCSLVTRLGRRATEALLLVLICLSPWPFGAVEPVCEFLLYVGAAAVLVLAAVDALAGGRGPLSTCPVLLCLAGLILLGVLQLTPLSRPLLEKLSPGTARLYERLLPEKPERLPGGDAERTAESVSGCTLSLHPGATREEVIQLLAVFALFAVVRSGTDSGASLRRLSVAAVANGALLALFGFVQFYTSQHDRLYWSYRTSGWAFGPFICRNHFAFYMNLCVGLGLGLLLRPGAVLPPATSRARRHRTRPWWALPSRTSGWDVLRGALGLFQDPRTAWLCAALALMISSVAFSQSRGGFLALVAALVAYVLLRVLVRGKSKASAPLPRSGAVLAACGLALVLVAWFGAAPVLERLQTLWPSDTWGESRLPLWASTWVLVKDFPVWGTGYGTFAFVEPLHRAGPIFTWVYDHAHNEYLEALVEGGVVRLALSVLAIVAVFRLGLRAAAEHRSRPEAALALGALAGFVALVVHSAVEFGLHIPAVALLATVLCGHLCALGSPRPARADQSFAHLPGPGAILAAGTALVLAFVLSAEGWRAEQVQRLRMTAFGLDPADGAERIALLTTAANLAPYSARLQVELGQAHQDVFAARCQERAERDATRASLTAALRHYLRARDLCPLLAKPHVELAAHVNALEQADERAAYLERAKFLVPAEPDLWYWCGVLELVDGRPDEAWQSWRHSLGLFDVYAPEILDASSRFLGAEQVRDVVLPDQPRLLVKAALRLYPGPNQAEVRKGFFEKALGLLDTGPPPEAEDLRLKAFLLETLGRPDEALTAYRAALIRMPLQTAWRYDFARLLAEQGQFSEARREVLSVLAREPNYRQAQELRATVERRLAEKYGASASARSPGQ